MYNAGRAVRVQHIRNGKELKEIVYDNNYDFNFQVRILSVFVLYIIMHCKRSFVCLPINRKKCPVQCLTSMAKKVVTFVYQGVVVLITRFLLVHLS